MSEQKSILITGCSSGIGYGVAHDLRAEGWRVFASCRKAEDCARLEHEGFESPLIDYADAATIEAGLNEVIEATDGTLDALFNNGAFAIPGLVEDLPTEALREIFETNVFGQHELTRRAIRVMRAQGHGRILNNSSVLGIVALPWRGAYNATKFALTGLTETLRLEMEGSGIHIILIEPGPVTSDIRKNSIPHFERWVKTDGTAREADYARLRGRLYKTGGKDNFELPPSAVTKKVLHALTAARPRPRYFVTTPTYFAETLRRLLPTRWRDRIILKS
ncbi:MAG: SDR family NAD(P)-dependent oxidoreductase [Rhodobacteraceae bacterium]|nr:SDR family NAD(P)-dependent oxidoreductase [Paracoccaceae bacterium]